MQHKLRRYFKLYMICLRTLFISETAYRLNFVLGMVITFISNILFPLVTLLIYANGQSFPGWNFWQVLLIQSIFTISTGISNTFFAGIFWETNANIKNGSFEVILLKPVNPLFFIMATTFNFQGIAYIIGGFIMFALSAAHCAVWTISGVLNFLLFGTGGIFVMLGIELIMSATSFKWIGNSRIPEIFDSIKQFAKYPMTIFPSLAKGICTFILPVAAVAFMPASALMGKTQVSFYSTLIPCAVFAGIGFLLYFKMIKLYESAGG